MIHLDAELRRVASGRAGWSEWQSLAVLGVVCASMGMSSVVWDFDAGERWAHVQDDEGLRAIIRMSSPLVFVTGRVSGLDLLVPDERLVVVRVSDPHKPELVASPDSVADAFPERPLSSTLVFAGFSVYDLCFASD